MIKTLLLLFLIAFPPNQETRVKKKQMDLYTFLWQKKLQKQWNKVEEVFIDCIVNADGKTFTSLWSFLEKKQKRILVQNDHFFPISNTILRKMSPLTAFVRLHSSNIKAKKEECIIIVKELIRYGASWNELNDDDLPIMNQWLDSESLNLLKTPNNELP